MKRLGLASLKLAIVGCLIGLIIFWQRLAPGSSSIVVYFGRPSDFFQYIGSNWNELARASSLCLFTAILSLALACVFSVVLLVLGLLAEGWLTLVERLAASSQSIPVLVIVAIALLVETALFDLFSIKPSTWAYCIGPVTLALLFPPLVNGAAAILRMPIEIKALLRIWQVPAWWRIFRIYLPGAIPDILTGIRTSATWAVGATLITEGLLNGVEGDTLTLGRFLVRLSHGEQKKRGDDVHG